MNMFRGDWTCPHCRGSFGRSRRLNAMHAAECATRQVNEETKKVDEEEKKVAEDAAAENILTLDALGSNGRLGNQMFQIASTIGIADRNDAEAVFPPWYCTYTKKHMSQFFKNVITQRALVQIHPKHKYQEPTFTYTEVPFRKNMIIRGYFQTEKYFNNCKALIRRYFEPTDQITDSLVLKYGTLLEGNTCAVHIRRGDYVNHAVHGTCDIPYYRRGMEYIDKKVGVDRFFIFSDDIDWCKQNFRGENHVFIEGNIDVYDLFLMSMCKHFVISNSSFSWWGSWLRKSNEKITVAPTKWFTDNANMDQSDVYTNEMTKL